MFLSTKFVRLSHFAIRKSSSYRTICLLLFLSLGGASKATNYYVNAMEGNDSNPGTAMTKPWKSLAPLRNIRLTAGDSLLLAAGQGFTGPLLLWDIKGTVDQPVYVGNYSVKGNLRRAKLDAGMGLYALHIRNSAFIRIEGIEITARLTPVIDTDEKQPAMRCGILAEITRDELFESIVLRDIQVHDIFLMPKGYKRPVGEIKTANGTQGYGFGIRFINNSQSGTMKNLQVLQSEIYSVSHTGLKFTARRKGIQQVVIAGVDVRTVGGPGIQLSGVSDAHIHNNHVNESGSTADSRNWGRGSGLWTWSCDNILIEHNRFENANGPGDSAGVHIDYNCNDVIVQYNFSANNAGGFCEILGNNYNCAYRYNISVNDGFRIKGQDGAFQEGKIFWLSGYQGNQKPGAGPYNSYFYNNTMYVDAAIEPKIAISPTAKGILIANNIFYFRNAAKLVASDQKKNQGIAADSANDVVFSNNLFLRPDNWPPELRLRDTSPLLGDPKFRAGGGMKVENYIPGSMELIQNKGLILQALPNDSIGLRRGLVMKMDILGRPINDIPDIGAIEWQE